MPCNGLSRRRVTLPRDTTLLGRHNLKTAEPSGEQAKLLASTGRPDKYNDVSEESVTKDLANAHNATQSACLARTARLFRSWSALWGGPEQIFNVQKCATFEGFLFSNCFNSF